MIDISLRQLRYALALAQTGHFGRAADICAITQPALSQQIKHLEEICGTPLFDRTGRSARPTPFGQDFLVYAARVVSESDELVSFVESKANGPARPVRLGIIPTIAPYLLPAIYPGLIAEFAPTQFTITESQTDSLLTSVQKGTLDIALIATDPPPEFGLASAFLFADPFVLASPQSASYPAIVDLHDLPREKILLLEEGHCLRDQAIDACALRISDQPGTFAATSLATIVEFVANGQGITLLPTISLKKEAANERIRIHELAAPGASRSLQLVWRKNSPFEPLFQKIAETIKASGQASLASPM